VNEEATVRLLTVAWVEGVQGSALETEFEATEVQKESNFILVLNQLGASCSEVVKAQCCRPKGRGVEIR
jgi:hypothetical protein